MACLQLAEEALKLAIKANSQAAGSDFASANATAALAFGRLKDRLVFILT
jgi:hypothetical protein